MLTFPHCFRKLVQVVRIVLVPAQTSSALPARHVVVTRTARRFPRRRCSTTIQPSAVYLFHTLSSPRGSKKPPGITQVICLASMYSVSHLQWRLNCHNGLTEHCTFAKTLNLCHSSSRTDDTASGGVRRKKKPTVEAPYVANTQGLRTCPVTLTFP